MKNLKVLKALAEETRMTILEILLQKPSCVSQLARTIGLTEATISQHLKVLREAGLVRGQKIGYYRHYEVRSSVLIECAQELQDMAARQGEVYKDCPYVNEVKQVRKADKEADHGHGQGQGS